jgi:tetratricopeptide (TPR) repeat protein
LVSEEVSGAGRAEHELRSVIADSDSDPDLRGHALLDLGALLERRARDAPNDRAKSNAGDGAIRAYARAIRLGGPRAAHAARRAAAFSASVGSCAASEDYWALARSLAWGASDLGNGLVPDFALLERTSGGKWRFAEADEHERSAKPLFGTIPDFHHLEPLSLEGASTRPILGVAPSSDIGGSSFAVLDGHGGAIRLPGDDSHAQTLVEVLRTVQATVERGRPQDLREAIMRLADHLLPSSGDNNELRLLVLDFLKRNGIRERMIWDVLAPWDPLAKCALRIVDLFDVVETIDKLSRAAGEGLSAEGEVKKLVALLASHRRGSATIVADVVSVLETRGVGSSILERITTALDDKRVHEHRPRRHRPVDVRDSLVTVAPRLGASLMRVLYALERGRPPTRDALISLVDRLWAVEVTRIPVKVRKRLPRLLDRLNYHLNERGAPGPSATGVERVLSRQAQARSLVLIRLLKHMQGDDLLGDDLKDLYLAIVALESAKTFDRSSQLLDESIRNFLQETVRRLPSRVDDFLQRVEQEGGETLNRPNWRFLACVNAAHALFASAKLARNEGRIADARQLLETGDAYFSVANLHRRPSSFQDWIKLTPAWVSGRVDHSRLLGASEPTAVVASVQRARKLFDSLPAPIPKPDWHVLELEAKLTLAEIDAGITDPEAASVRRIWIELVQDQPGNQTAWARLVRHLATEERDLDATVDAMDQWLAAAAATPRANLAWVQYQIAALCGELARSESDWLPQAVHRYVNVLIDQPPNHKAACELLELFGEQPNADQHLDELARLPDITETGASLAQSLVRLVFARHGSPDLRSLASAVSVVIAGDAGDVAEKAREWVVRALTEPRADEHAFEPLLDGLTKALIGTARQSIGTTALVGAASLLDLALSARFENAWWTRRTRVAILLRDYEAAETLRSGIGPAELQDPDVAIQMARLDLMLGRPSRASALLAEVTNGITSGRRDVGPEALDAQTFLALRIGDFDAAAQLYREFLEKHPYDPIASFGLGRVAFESGDTSAALEHWLASVRVWNAASERRNDDRSWLTARSIGALVARAPVGDVETRFLRAIREEEPGIAAQLIDGLRSGGSAREELVTELLAYELGDRVNRQTAQLLMAQLIRRAVEVGEDNADPTWRLASRAVTWARRHDVLPELIAGAKASYARAVIGQAHIGRRPQPLPGPSQLTQEELVQLLARCGLTEAYERILRQVRETRHYYRDVRQLLARANPKDADLIELLFGIIAASTRPLLPDKAQGATATEATAPRLLRDLEPVRTLQRFPGMAVAEARPALSGAYFDAEALQLAGILLAPYGWEFGIDEFEARVDRTANTELLRRLAHGGILFTTRGEHQYCAVACTQPAGRADFALGVPETV